MKKDRKKYDARLVCEIASTYVAPTGETYKTTSVIKNVPVGSMGYIMKKVAQSDAELFKKVRKHAEENRYNRRKTH